MRIKKQKRLTTVKFSGTSDLSAEALEQRTLCFTIKSDKSTLDVRKRLFEDCCTAKDLYNQALYIFRQNLAAATKFEEDNPGKKWVEETGKNKWLSYYDIEPIIRVQTNLEGEINYYKMLTTACSQQCLQGLSSNINVYVKLIKRWSKNKSAFKGMPKLPNYRPKWGVLTTVFTTNAAKIKADKDGTKWYLQLTKKIPLIPIPKPTKRYLEANCIKLNQVRVVPLTKSKLLADDPQIEIQIVYTIDVSKKNRSNKLNESSALAIDLGVDNFASIISTSGKTLLLKGKDHKSRLLHYQHKIAKARSKFDKDRLRCLKNKLKKAKKQANIKEVKQLDA